MGAAEVAGKLRQARRARVTARRALVNDEPGVVVWGSSGRPVAGMVCAVADAGQARALLDAHLAGGDEGVLRALDEHLPGVGHGPTREGVVRRAADTAELLRRREALVERVRADRAAPQSP